MKLIIDKLDDIASWTGTLPIQKNEHEDFIAHFNTASVMLVPNLNLNATKSLTLNQDLTGYEYIVLDCQSLYKGVIEPNSPDEMNYQIDFGFQKYYLPAPPKFGKLKFRIAGTETITKIEITCLHNDRDVLVLSHLQAVKEQPEIDIITSLCDAIQVTEYNVGTVSAIIGNNFFIVSNPVYIDKYSRIKLGSHYYGVKDLSGNKVTINDLYDGPTIKANYSDIGYMSPPVEYGKEGEAVTIPGIVVWGDVPSLVDVDNRFHRRIESFKINVDPDPDTVDIVEINDNYVYAIQIDCESQYRQVLEDLKSSVKKIVDKRALWVNGTLTDLKLLDIRRQDGEYETTSFIFALELSEETWKRTQNYPLTATTTGQVTPVAL